MAIEVPSISADVCETENTQLRTATVKSLAPAFVTVGVVLCSMLAAGCARNPPEREVSSTRHEVKAAPVRAAARPRRYSEQSSAKPIIRKPDAALLAPQPAPDCEFNRPGVSAVDPNEWTRLKIEYERQCYQDAEKAARERLSQLQAASNVRLSLSANREWFTNNQRSDRPPRRLRSSGASLCLAANREVPVSLCGNGKVNVFFSPQEARFCHSPIDFIVVFYWNSSAPLGAEEFVEEQ